MHRLKAAPKLLIVKYGVMSVLNARGRLTPKVTSPVDRDHSFLFVFCLHLPSILYRFDVISAFLIAENGGKPISVARVAC
jgi:hypothetical protein